jgi:predicted RNase H-like HicB family nuclease
MNTKNDKIFTVVYEPAEEGGFVVSVVGLQGCYSQGDTFEEAQKNIIEAISLYLEESQENEEAFTLPVIGNVMVHA